MVVFHPFAVLIDLWDKVRDCLKPSTSLLRRFLVFRVLSAYVGLILQGYLRDWTIKLKVYTRRIPTSCFIVPPCRLSTFLLSLVLHRGVPKERGLLPCDGKHEVAILWSWLRDYVLHFQSSEVCRVPLHSSYLTLDTLRSSSSSPEILLKLHLTGEHFDLAGWRLKMTHTTTPQSWRFTVRTGMAYFWMLCKFSQTSIWRLRNLTSFLMAGGSWMVSVKLSWVHLFWKIARWFLKLALSSLQFFVPCDFTTLTFCSLHFCSISCCGSRRTQN